MVRDEIVRDEKTGDEMAGTKRHGPTPCLWYFA